MDETGFQMGQSHSEYVVFNSTQGPPLSSISENTHWVSIIKCIALNRAIRPCMIFKGKQPETNWVPDTWELPHYLYAFSEKGWTDNDLGVDWLKRIFIPETFDGQKHRILIIDGHDSHETGNFQYLCCQNNIYPLFYPLIRLTSFNRLIWVYSRRYQVPIKRPLKIHTHRRCNA